MPWDETAGGFTKHTKSGKGGGFVRNPGQYEASRRKGMSKQRAAAITNSDNVSKAFGVEIEKFKLSDPQGNAYQRPPRKNTRKQNVAVGSSVGATEYGAIGAIAGAASGKLERRDQGVHRAGPTHGVSTYMRPPKALTRAKRAGKVGAAAGAVGAGFGAGLGAISAHRRKKDEKLPMGRVNKSTFDVEVEKAFDKTRERNARDKKLRNQLTRKQGLKAASGAALYTAAKAPSGRHMEAFREHGRYMGDMKDDRGGIVGVKKPGLTHRGAYVHTRQ